MPVGRGVPFMAVWAPAFVLCLGLAGCQSFRESLGITKVSPDEFLVSTRKPLLLPPDLNLRPPQPGAPPRNELPPSGQARLALFPRGLAGGPQVASAGFSDGEIALLESTGALNAGLQIRRIVDAESRQPEGRRPALAALPAPPPIRIVRPEVNPPVPTALAVIPAPSPLALPEAADNGALVPVEIAAEDRPIPAPAPLARQRLAAAGAPPPPTAGLIALRRTLER